MKEDLLRRCLPIVYPICSNFYLQFNLFIIEIRKDFLQIRIDKFKTPVKKSFQIIFISILCIFSSINLFTQDNNYFKAILDNGYAWISLCEPLSIIADNRYNYLVSLLGNQRLKKLSKSNYFLIDCEDDIKNLISRYRR